MTRRKKNAGSTPVTTSKAPEPTHGPPEVVFYITPSGREIVQDEILALNKKYPGAGAELATAVQDVADGRLPGKHLPPHGLWEVKVSLRGNALRVLYKIVRGPRGTAAVFLAARAFAKKDQQTPPPEIEVAQKRVKDFCERHGMK